MRILHAINVGYPSGGAEKSVCLLCDELKKRGHEVKIFSSDIVIGDESRFSDYEFKSINTGSPFRIFSHIFYRRSYLAMRKIVKDFKPDIIHFHTVSEFSPSVFFAIADTPSVMTVHGPEEFTLNLLPWFMSPNDYDVSAFDLKHLTTAGKFHYLFYRYIQRPLYLLGIRKLRFVIAPSHFIADAIKGEVDEKKIRQIYNGITLPSYKPLPKNNKILFVGRLEKIKGVDYLIKAFAIASEIIPSLELHVVGEGSARKEFEEQARSLKCGDKIKFLGWMNPEDVIREYENTTIVAVPSICPEIQGLVVVEAMSVGRAVIATRTGGIPELIEDGKNGLLVPIGDEIAMSDAIVKLFSIGNDIDRISKTAALDSKRFDIGLCTDKIESLYGEMLKH